MSEDDPSARRTKASSDQSDSRQLSESEEQKTTSTRSHESPLTEQSRDTATTSRESVDYEPRLSNVLVGIPAYNEAVAIGSVVLATRRLTENILVVDDGSSDDTARIASDAGARVVRHEQNEGKGAAIKTIFDYAIMEEYDALVLLDGDGQHMPADIPDVVGPVLEGESDMTIGSRYIGQERTKTPLHRRFGQKVLDYATVGATGESVSDSQSGFRAFSPYAMKKLSLSTDGMGIESEILSEASEYGIEFEEVPIDIRYEVPNAQTYNPFRHGLSVLVFILRMARKRHPLALFSLPGVALLLLGCGVAIHSLLLYRSGGTLAQWRVTISAVAVALGAATLSIGLTTRQHIRS